MYVWIYIYIYIYIYIHVFPPPGGPQLLRKATNGVSTNGVAANCVFFDRGTFWVLRLTYFCLPKSARAYLFPQSVKIDYFCGGPISVDPICPQPDVVRVCSSLRAFQGAAEVYTHRCTSHAPLPMTRHRFGLPQFDCRICVSVSVSVSVSLPRARNGCRSSATRILI